jgi:hypothetical protein|tara:strand:- start:4265 stop:4462 length:198 start_codon:yes stop_codon:yes gene_type:complete
MTNGVTRNAPPVFHADPSRGGPVAVGLFFGGMVQQVGIQLPIQFARAKLAAVDLSVAAWNRADAN